MAIPVEDSQFQYLHRIFSTNVSGTRRSPKALCTIKGIGARLSPLICKTAGINLTDRAGNLTAAEIQRLPPIIQRPEDFMIPSWMLNRRKDPATGQDLHIVSTQYDTYLRTDYQRLTKMKSHRGFRHTKGWKVRGQHTNSTGRGRTCSGLGQRKH